MKLMYYQTLPAFERFSQPNSIEETISLLANLREEANILAGGTDLLVLMRSRALRPTHLIDINRIPALNSIFEDAHRGLTIGALVKLRAGALSEKIRKVCPSLNEALRQMATPQVRNMATVVGNICRASPSGDTIPPLLSVGSKVTIVGSSGTRIVPLDEFFVGPGETVLGPDEMVKEIQVPKLPNGTGTVFLRVSRSRVDLAKVSVAVMLTTDGEACKDARIALGGVAPIPMRARKAEEVIRSGGFRDETVEETARAAADETRPITDIRSTEAYRKEASRILTARAIRLCIQRAREG